MAKDGGQVSGSCAEVNEISGPTKIMEYFD